MRKGVCRPQTDPADCLPCLPGESELDGGSVPALRPADRPARVETIPSFDPASAIESSHPGRYRRKCFQSQSRMCGPVDLRSSYCGCAADCFLRMQQNGPDVKR